MSDFKSNERVKIDLAVGGLFKNYVYDGAPSGVRVALDGRNPKFWAIVPVECVEKENPDGD